jgi:hypothetical protein
MVLADRIFPRSKKQCTKSVGRQRGSTRLGGLKSIQRFLFPKEDGVKGSSGLDAASFHEKKTYGVSFEFYGDDPPVASAPKSTSFPQGQWFHICSLT